MKKGRKNYPTTSFYLLRKFYFTKSDSKKKLKAKKASPTKEADTNTTLASMNISSSTFNKLVEIITNKNKIRH